MTRLGQILVVCILLMSVTFMSFAVMVYSTHKNWKAVVEGKGPEQKGLKQTLDDLRNEKGELEAKVDSLQKEIEKEKTDKSTAVAKLETASSMANKELEKVTQEKTELAGKEAKAVAALATSSLNEKKLTEENDILRKEIRTAQDARDKSFAEVVKLTDKIHQAENNVVLLTARNKQLADQVAKARELLAAHGESFDTPLDKEPPTLRGKVLAINDEGLIEISLGADDGLRAGHKIEVYRGAKYLGRVQVLSTSPDKAVGKIMKDISKGPIQKGDDVATRFKVG